MFSYLFGLKLFIPAGFVFSSCFCLRLTKLSRSNYQKHPPPPLPSSLPLHLVCSGHRSRRGVAMETGPVSTVAALAAEELGCWLLRTFSGENKADELWSCLRTVEPSRTQWRHKGRTMCCVHVGVWHDGDVIVKVKGQRSHLYLSSEESQYSQKMQYKQR